MGNGAVGVSDSYNFTIAYIQPNHCVWGSNQARAVSAGVRAGRLAGGEDRHVESERPALERVSRQHNYQD